MAIEPKTPRKRAVKKTSAKPDVKSEIKPAEKVVVTRPAAANDETKKTPRKKPAAIPVPIFQSPIFQAAPEKPLAKVARKKVAQAPIAAPDKAVSSEVPQEGAGPEGSEDAASRNRRRRRGGRGRRKPGAEGVGGEEGSDLEVQGPADGSDGADASEGSTHRRRRRRVAGVDGVVPGESVEDGVITVVKLREVRERAARPARAERTDRSERRGSRTARSDRSERSGRSEYREPYRKRGTVITDGEFLARRENVDREMLVRQIADRTQIAVIEDGIMVEHYVNRNSNVSYVGNVYLGRVQNVLPSMEAAFVDIGKGRNAVLYAGEVNWDAAGISESAPRKIETVLKSGQSVLVQVTKDPIGQKGARLTSQISLPGRYVVYVPGGGMSGISKRLPESERTRLKAILKNLIPESAGVIVRTAAEGVSEEDLTSDVARLKAQWDDIYAKSENPNFHPPAALYQEPDLAVRVIRDIFNEDFRKLTVQGANAWDEVTSYLGFIAPELTTKIEKYTGVGDLFSDFRVEEQLAKAFDRKVYLPSGGSIVIDRTEAMIVVDVNTGKFIGKGGNLEETVTKNNLEAAEEIARQLRLRDLGGIVVIDFIDMILESNREMVLRRLVEALGRDRTKHQVAEVTSLGLVQMTRKRVGQGLIEAFSTTCDACSGRGIHIHMEPVKMKAAMPMQEIASARHEVADELVTSNHELEEASDMDESEDAAISTQLVVPEVKTGGRKRRRASSSGIITA